MGAPESLEFEHFICTQDGTWVSAKDYPEDDSKVIFASGSWGQENDSFPCARDYLY
jgi:hypothetical protein